MDHQNLEDSYNMDSFVDSTFDFLEQETENFKPLKIEIPKPLQTINKESEQNGCDTSPIGSCASPLVSFLDQVSDRLLSSAHGHTLRDGGPDLEKLLDSKPSSPTTGSSTEVLSTSTFGTNPSSLPFDQVNSLDPSDISLAQTMINPPGLSLSTSVCPSSKFSGVCVPPLLVTLPTHQTPPTILSLNLTPVGTPLPLLHLHLVPTSGIVDRLVQLKQRTLKGSTERLTCKTPKTQLLTFCYHLACQ